MFFRMVSSFWRRHENECSLSIRIVRRGREILCNLETRKREVAGWQKLFRVARQKIGVVSEIFFQPRPNKLGRGTQFGGCALGGPPARDVGTRQDSSKDLAR